MIYVLKMYYRWSAIVRRYKIFALTPIQNTTIKKFILQIGLFIILYYYLCTWITTDPQTLHFSCNIFADLRHTIKFAHVVGCCFEKKIKLFLKIMWLITIAPLFFKQTGRNIRILKITNSDNNNKNSDNRDYQLWF